MVHLEDWRTSDGSAARFRANIVAATLQVRSWRLQELLAAKRFNPDQPRVPGGYRYGGRWVGEGDEFGPLAGTAGNSILVGIQGDDDLPDLPDEPPTSGRERHRIARSLARYLRDANVSVRLAIIAAQYAWILDSAARDIISYFDPPKSLEELRDAVSEPLPGYEGHHLVEQTPARRDGIPEDQIQSRENRVRIPKFKHWQITGWYGRPNEDYGGLSPREFLRGASWNERMEVGIRALILHGVLEP